MIRPGIFRDECVGQNASTGTFNIQSKKPTSQWEGDLDMEYGNNGTYELSFGVGGPINDTWGIRCVRFVPKADIHQINRY